MNTARKQGNGIAEHPSSQHKERSQGQLSSSQQTAQCQGMVGLLACFLGLLVAAATAEAHAKTVHHSTLVETHPKHTTSFCTNTHPRPPGRAHGTAGVGRPKHSVHSLAQPTLPHTAAAEPQQRALPNPHNGSADMPHMCARGVALVLPMLQLCLDSSDGCVQPQTHHTSGAPIPNKIQNRLLEQLMCALLAGVHRRQRSCIRFPAAPQL